MWKKEWNIKINEIWYDFSECVPETEIDHWKDNLKKESGAGSPAGGTALKECPDGELTGKNPNVLLVTDSTKRCKEAMKTGVPFLLYLHSKNQEESFEGIPFAVMELKDVTLSYAEKIFQRFRNIPWTILETDRCIIREITEDDLEELYQIYEEPSISLYTENLYEDPQKERAYIRDYIEQVYKFCGYGIWAVIHKESGRMIGRAGLACREGFDTPELGYVIAVPYQRRGYAAEVCRAILDYSASELGFSQIRVLFHHENVASLRLCQKLGFQRDGEMLMDGENMLQYIYKGTVKNEDK
ncbi:MAG: GNAT family N-acetyltransferase [Lachnospiraceae bacterium]|nr:GNAT family N-acetyltransferase [Lachnospiraceae bacterium]